MCFVTRTLCVNRVRTSELHEGKSLVNPGRVQFVHRRKLQVARGRLSAPLHVPKTITSHDLSDGWARGARVPRWTDNWKSVSHISIRRIVESLNTLAPSFLLFARACSSFMKMFNVLVLLFYWRVTYKNYIVIHFMQK